MIDFDFVSPTKIYFGEGKEERVGAISASYGFKKALIVIGGRSALESGLLDKVCLSLNEQNIEYKILKGVRPNPTISKVREGLAIAKEFKPDYLLAVGGGSVIDTSKSIACGYFYDGDAFDFNLKKAVPTKALPIGVILTHSSAGSELSNSCVIQDDETMIKQGFNTDLDRPLFAIENPKLTYSVSPYQTAAGISDSMMHSIERFFAPSGENQLADDLAIAVIKNLMVAGKKVMENPTDYQARGSVMLASSLAHNGLTNIGKGFQFVVHPLEHALSGYKADITHGAGVAMVYIAWATYYHHHENDKFAKLARSLFDIKEDNDEKAAIIGIERMKEFFISIGMPVSFKEVGLNESDIAPLVSIATGNGTRVIGCYPQSLTEKDVEAIYRLLL